MPESPAPGSPAPGPALVTSAAASTGSGLAQAIGEQFSFEKSIGGVRGILESVLPLTVFSVVYGITHDLVPSCVAALVPSVVLAVVRLLRRETLMQALSGVIGVGIGAFLAVRTGRAQNFFLPSILKNSGYAAAYAISVVVRWPLVGVVAGFLLGEVTHWRQVPARARVYVQATWVWCAMFVVRLVVQVPLYLLGKTTVLGLVSIPLGIPLFAVVLWLTWVIIRRVPVAHLPGHHGEHAGHGHHLTDGAPSDADGEPDPLTLEEPSR